MSRDASDLADLLRMQRLPEAWIAPPQVEQLRELVRYRAKIVAIRSGSQGPAARRTGQGRGVDSGVGLFGVERANGSKKTPLAGPYAQRVGSLLHLIDVLDAEEAVFAARIAGQLSEHRGYRAIEAFPLRGPRRPWR